MKFCALGKGFTDALKGLSKKLQEDADQIGIIGTEETGLIVMSFEKFNQLQAAANKPAQVVKEYVLQPYPVAPYNPNPWRGPIWVVPTWQPNWYGSIWSATVTCNTSELPNGSAVQVYNVDSPGSVMSSLSYDEKSFDVMSSLTFSGASTGSSDLYS